MSEINVKYTYLKQISHTTHSDNIFEVVQYKKFDKTYIEIEKHEQNESNTILLLIEPKLMNIENHKY